MVMARRHLALFSAIHYRRHEILFRKRCALCVTDNRFIIEKRKGFSSVGYFTPLLLTEKKKYFG